MERNQPMLQGSCEGLEEINQLEIGESKDLKKFVSTTTESSEKKQRGNLG